MKNQLTNNPFKPMSSRPKVMFLIVVLLSTAGAVAWLVFEVIRGAWRAASANPTVAVAVLSAGATVVTATITVMLGRHFERRKEIEAHFRADKIRIYDEFLSELFKTFQSTQDVTEDSKLVDFFREWQRKVVLWGGSDVLRTYVKWMARIKAGNLDAHTVFLMEDFLRALRSDIGQSSAGLQRGSFAHLILRHSELFLAEAAKNPKITLAELSRGKLEQ